MKWTSIRDKKPSAIAAAVPVVLAFVAALALVVTVGVFLTATKCAVAALRRKSRRQHFLSNLYMLPEGYGDFNFHSVHVKTGTED